MRTRRNNSSESGSLELLLDTMCNTFGGVMFIAISLVVIASFIPKFLDNKCPEKISKADLEKIESEISRMSKAIEEMSIKRKLDEIMINKYNGNPNLALIQEFAKLKEENARLADLLVSLSASGQALKLGIEIVYEENEQKEKRQKEIEDKIKKAEKDFSDEKEKLEIAAEITKREIAACKNKKKIVYAKKKRTDKMPYFVIVDGNDIFPISDKIHETLVNNNGAGKIDFHTSENVSCTFIEAQSKVCFAPKKGFCGGNISDTALDDLLRGISNENRFIWAMVKDDSFSTFIKLRDFVREKGFDIYWYPVVDNSEYYLTLTDKVDYEAQ